MSMRYVTLGCGRKVPLGAYVAAWKKALDAPLGSRFNGSPSDSRLPASREDVLREFRAGMTDRINRNVPGFGKGRKWASDYYWSMRRAAQEVNNPRLIIRYLPPDLMKRPKLAARVEYGRSI